MNQAEPDSQAPPAIVNTAEIFTSQPLEKILPI